MDKQDNRNSLLCRILEEISECLDDMEVDEYDYGTGHLTEFRCTPTFEFTDEDIETIHELGKEMGEDFSKITGKDPDDE